MKFLLHRLALLSTAVLCTSFPAGAMTLTEFLEQPRPDDFNDGFVRLEYNDQLGLMGRICIEPNPEGECLFIQEYQRSENGWRLVAYSAYKNASEDYYVIFSAARQLRSDGGQVCVNLAIPANMSVVGIGATPSPSRDLVSVTREGEAHLINLYMQNNTTKVPYVACQNVSIRHVGDPSFGYQWTKLLGVESEGRALPLTIHEPGADLVLYTDKTMAVRAEMLAGNPSTDGRTPTQSHLHAMMEQGMNSAAAGSAAPTATTAPVNQLPVQPDSPQARRQEQIAAHINQFITVEADDPEDIEPYLGTWVNFRQMSGTVLDISPLEGDQLHIKVTRRHADSFSGSRQFFEDSTTGTITGGKLVAGDELTRAIFEIQPDKGALIAHGMPPFMRVDLNGQTPKEALSDNYQPAYLQRLGDLGLD